MSRTLRYQVPTPADDRRPLTDEEMEQAVCAQIGDPELFFAEKGTPYTDAEKVCTGCPIAARCIAANLGEEYGFFASSPPQRKRIRKEIERAERKPTLTEFWAGVA